MQQSAAVIEAALGKRPAHFSYPVGDRTSAGPREFRDRRRARLQDRGDDAAGRAVPRARRAPDRAAAHLAQRRVPAAALRQGAALGRRHGAVERLPPGRRGLRRCPAATSSSTSGMAGSTQPMPGDHIEQRHDKAALRAQRELRERHREQRPDRHQHEQRDGSDQLARADVHACPC